MKPESPLVRIAVHPTPTLGYPIATCYVVIRAVEIDSVVAVTIQGDLPPNNPCRKLAMSKIELPTDRSYTTDHEWIDIEPGALSSEGPVRVGITSVAVDALGDLVFVQLPEIGDTITAGTVCGEVESTKTVSDLIAPATGQVTEVNTAAVDDPAVIGADPYGQGWLFAVQATALGPLLTATEYAQQNGHSS